MDSKAKIEITETDITKYPKLKSDRISVFGISLGMSKSDVNNLIEQNKNLYFKVDVMQKEDYRIYVYNRFLNCRFLPKKDCILYLIWKKKCNPLTSITFYTDFKPYLVGLSSKLLTFDAIDKNSTISQEYLGNPDEIKVTLDIPLVQLKNTSYFFKSKGIDITEVNTGDSKNVTMGFNL